MSLYNMVNGSHPFSGNLLGILGFKPETFSEIPRFRDIFLFDNEIRLLTKTGGGNREEESWKEGIEKLQKHPLYVKDWDDEWDPCFMWVSFRLPETDEESRMNIEDENTGLRKATAEEVCEFATKLYEAIIEAINEAEDESVQKQMRTRYFPSGMKEMTDMMTAAIKQ